MRAANGHAAAALNAEVAARSEADEDAKRQDRVNREIAADLLATPTHRIGPNALPGACAYGDSEDEDMQQQQQQQQSDGEDDGP